MIFRFWTILARFTFRHSHPEMIDEIPDGQELNATAQWIAATIDTSEETVRRQILSTLRRLVSIKAQGHGVNVVWAVLQHDGMLSTWLTLVAAQAVAECFDPLEIDVCTYVDKRTKFFLDNLEQDSMPLAYDRLSLGERHAWKQAFAHVSSSPAISAADQAWRKRIREEGVRSELEEPFELCAHASFKQLENVFKIGMKLSLPCIPDMVRWAQRAWLDSGRTVAEFCRRMEDGIVAYPGRGSTLLEWPI